MVDVNKFISEGEILKYNGESIPIKPLSIEEQAKFATLQTQDKMGEASEYLLVTTLHKAWKEVPKEQLKAINDREFIAKVSDMILKVNGLEQKKLKSAKEE
jgi:hypothetical protein